MRSSRSLLTRSLAVTAALGFTLLSAAPATASGHSLLRDGFEGSVPDGPVIAGVAPGGAPWVLDDDSEVRLRQDGRIEVELDDLVIPPLNGLPARNPIPTMVASLVCGDMVVDSTRPFDVGTSGKHLGDGETKDHVKVPKHCKDPVILIRAIVPATGMPGPYFAFTQDEHSYGHSYGH